MPTPASSITRSQQDAINSLSPGDRRVLNENELAQRWGISHRTLERWRWLPPELDPKRVQVNVAAAVLTVFDGDRPVMSMKAVTGRPGNETPMLISRINSIVLNPPWNVPSSIATKELWPKEKASPGYLKRNGFRVIDTGDGGSTEALRLRFANEAILMVPVAQAPRNCTAWRSTASRLRWVSISVR